MDRTGQVRLPQPSPPAVPGLTDQDTFVCSCNNIALQIDQDSVSSAPLNTVCLSLPADFLPACRQDGANVDGWHWEEKQRLPWLREKLPELLVGLQAESSADGAAVRVTEVKSVDGEVCHPRPLERRAQVVTLCGIGWLCAAARSC